MPTWLEAILVLAAGGVGIFISTKVFMWCGKVEPHAQAWFRHLFTGKKPDGPPYGGPPYS